MRNFLIALVFSLSSIVVFAQQDRFIYLETDNSLPFYVKIDNKILNSQPSGYLIIPQLSDSTYTLSIGFVQNGSEQQFNCTINKKDEGFLIKFTNDKQWGLVNLQTHSILNAGNVIEKKVAIFTPHETKTDAFSVMLANTVHDSTILQNEITIADHHQKNADTKDSLTKNDTAEIVALNNAAILKPVEKKKLKKPAKGVHQKVVIKNTNPDNIVQNTNIGIAKDSTQITDTAKSIAILKPVIKKRSAKDVHPVSDSSALKKLVVKRIPKKIHAPVADTSRNTIKASATSIIKREMIKSTKDGLEMIYVDEHNKTHDTIRIIIVADSIIQDKKLLTQEVKTDTVLNVNKDNVNTLTSDGKVKTNNIVKVEETNKSQPITSVAMINSDCKSFATDDDFLKLRKKMVAENDDEAMIKVAKRTFKTRCFTTEQIKNLSVLFLKDEGKYMFFDASYPFVSDSETFSTLENQLTDNYYLTRFRAMIHK